MRLHLEPTNYIIILELDRTYLGQKLYKVCSSDNLWTTLIDFTAKSILTPVHLCDKFKNAIRREANNMKW